MTTTIAVLTGTAPNSTDNGVLAVHTEDHGGDAPVFDLMIELSDPEGRNFFGDGDTRLGVSWIRVTATYVVGTVYNHQHGVTDRIAVIDLDNTGGLDVLHLTNWVNHIEAAKLP